MNQTSEELKEVPNRAWIKSSMVISVFLFGLLIPYNLTVEANFNPLYIVMGIGTIPMFIIFIIVRKNLWKLSFDANHKVNFLKLLFWAFLFSSVLHTPLLLINKIAAKKFVSQGSVVKVANSFIGRDYISPHLVVEIGDSSFKIRMNRDQLESYAKGNKVTVTGIKGSLGYITESHVKQSQAGL